MYAPVKRIEMSLCCITSVVSYPPTYVVSEHASGSRRGLSIPDLSHRLGQPAMASIYKPQVFFERLTPFFDGYRYLLDFLSEI